MMEPSQAVALLTDVLFDFPFETPAHHSAAIAAIITLLSKSAIPGPCPMFLVDGNTSGVGKGLLTNVFTYIAENRPAKRYDLPKTNSNEFRKLVTSVAMSGVRYLLADNVKGKLGGATLENGITADRWEDRLLGHNRNVDLPLNFVWLATGNNAQLTRDMASRRVCHIRIQTKREHPTYAQIFDTPILSGTSKQIDAN